MGHADIGEKQAQVVVHFRGRGHRGPRIRAGCPLFYRDRRGQPLDEINVRETRVWLLIIRQAALIKPATALDGLLQETNELISIFVASLKTAEKGKR